MRKIPLIMSTQHPDCANLPEWVKGEIIKNDDEIKEAVHAFKLGCDEQLWDWEGKDVDPHVVRKLLSSDEEFFKENVLGEDVFITYRIPNPNIQRQEKKMIVEALESIPRHMDTATDFYGRDVVPIFEVALPMTTSHIDLLRIASYYERVVVNKDNLHIHPEIESITVKDWIGSSLPKRIEVIPLIEDLTSILNIHKILKEFIKRRELEYIRPWLARSDTALNYGLVSAVLMIKYALMRINQVQKDTDIPHFPILASGSLPFRGHLRPENIDFYLEEYDGFRTFAFQSAMKYDFTEREIKKTIRKIKVNQKKNKKKIHEKDGQKLKDVSELISMFSESYRDIVSKLANLVNRISIHIPSRRARKLHIGLFGYSRNLCKGVCLPRAIKFTASMYSIGLPPEFFGLNALHKVEKRGLTNVLNEQYIHLESDIVFASRFFSKESFELLIENELHTP